MNERATNPPKIDDFVCSHFDQLGRDDEIGCRDHDRALWDKQSATLHAIVDADVAASCVFSEPDVCDEILGHIGAFKKFQLGHSTVPLRSAKDYQNTSAHNSTQDSLSNTNFRSCNAFGHFYSIRVAIAEPLRRVVKLRSGGHALTANRSNARQRNNQHAFHFQHSVTRRAPINTGTSVDKLRFTDVGHKIFGAAVAIDHFGVMRFLERGHASSPEMNAADDRGKSSTALVHALSGALKRNHNNSNTAKTTASTIPTAIARIIASLSDIQRSPRRNQSAKKYSIISTTIAPMHHHIGNSFASSSRSSRSNLPRLRFAASTALAAISVARDSRTNADHRGFA